MYKTLENIRVDDNISMKGYVKAFKMFNICGEKLTRRPKLRWKDRKK